MRKPTQKPKSGPAWRITLVTMRGVPRKAMTDLLAKFLTEQGSDALREFAIEEDHSE